jgi:drug/metabolite transporter (DMT)-like permease
VTAAVAAPDRPLFGIGLILTAFLCFTAIDTSAKWLVLAGLPSGQVAFVRYAVHLAAALALFLPGHGAGLFRSARPRLQLFRGAMLLGSTLFNFVAVRYLPLTVTSAIFFTMPLLVCALSIPLLGERVGPRRWAAIVVGFGGVLIVTRPWAGDTHWAVLFSLAAALCASLYSLSTRGVAGSDSPATSQTLAALVGTLGAAPLALGGWVWPEAPPGWTAFALIGLFGFVGHQLLTVAHAHAPASTLAPFVYTQIVYMTASSWLVFDQPPDRWTLVGAGIVVASGLYVWLRERALTARAPGRPPPDGPPPPPPA